MAVDEGSGTRLGHGICGGDQDRAGVSVRFEGERGLRPIDRRTSVQPETSGSRHRRPASVAPTITSGGPDECGGQADLSSDDPPGRGPERLRPEQHDHVERETAGAHPTGQEGLERRVDGGENGQPRHPGHEQHRDGDRDERDKDQGRPSWRRRQGSPGRSDDPPRGVLVVCPARARRRSHPVRGRRGAPRSRPHRGAAPRSPLVAAAPRWRSPAAGKGPPGSARGARRVTSAHSRPRRARRAGIAPASLDASWRLRCAHSQHAREDDERRGVQGEDRCHPEQRDEQARQCRADGAAHIHAHGARGRTPPGSASARRGRGSSPARQGR